MDVFNYSKAVFLHLCVCRCVSPSFHVSLCISLHLSLLCLYIALHLSVSLCISVSLCRFVSLCLSFTGQEHPVLVEVTRNREQSLLGRHVERAQLLREPPLAGDTLSAGCQRPSLGTLTAGPPPCHGCLFGWRCLVTRRGVPRLGASQPADAGITSQAHSAAARAGARKARAQNPKRRPRAARLVLCSRARARAPRSCRWSWGRDRSATSGRGARGARARHTRAAERYFGWQEAPRHFRRAACRAGGFTPAREASGQVGCGCAAAALFLSEATLGSESHELKSLRDGDPRGAAEAAAALAASSGGLSLSGAEPRSREPGTLRSPLPFPPRLPSIYWETLQREPRHTKATFSALPAQRGSGQ
ncbi:PREDICTED: uncharacterized protein LOC102855092 [Elephantulus edwardii]|uniref:uncharacterized protein LOC102855092 n=1 Tax=Elephantulus edwardii TaxID=28737 RepID=UPI0003F0A7A2|nr:PREDICTED: uncharacterized protein LOC102855092 [Elephantulus edwardii]